MILTSDYDRIAILWLTPVIEARIALMTEQMRFGMETFLANMNRVLLRRVFIERMRAAEWRNN